MLQNVGRPANDGSLQAITSNFMSNCTSLSLDLEGLANGSFTEHMVVYSSEWLQNLWLVYVMRPTMSAEKQYTSLRCLEFLSP